MVRQPSHFLKVGKAKQEVAPSQTNVVLDRFEKPEAAWNPI